MNWSPAAQQGLQLTEARPDGASQLNYCWADISAGSEERGVDPMAYWRMQLHPSQPGEAIQHAVTSLAANFIGLDFGSAPGPPLISVLGSWSSELDG